MQAVKEAFLAQDALAVVTALVAEPLARHPRMTQQDTLLVQLVITFLRNLLAIPDQYASGGLPHNSSQDLHDMLPQAIMKQSKYQHGSDMSSSCSEIRFESCQAFLSTVKTHMWPLWTLLVLTAAVSQ